MNKIKEHPNKTAISQKNKIKKLFLLSATNHVLFLGFAWIVLQVIFGKEFVWKFGFTAVGAEILFLVMGLILIRTKFMHRAILLYLFFALIYLPVIIGLIDTFVRVILHLYGAQGWFTIAFEIIFLIAGLLIQVRKKKDNLRLAVNRNVKSGMLNLVTGEWNLTITPKFGTVEMEEKSKRRAKRLEYLAPFAPFLGMMINRTFGKNIAFEVLGYCMFFFAILLGWGGIALYLAIVFQLLDWEKETGRKITLLRENPQ